jgi:N-acetylglutamate synthase
MGRVEPLDELFGARVSLRYRLGERDGRALYSDAVGELSRDETDGAVVVVATRRGPVRVERAAVVAVRAVPPPVPRRPSWAAVARLEGLCADAWPAQVDVPLGAWRLRASGDRAAAPPPETPGSHAGRPAAVGRGAGGFTGRANAALAIGDPGLPLREALDAVRAFAAAHGIPPRVQVPIGSPWDRAVEAVGWALDSGPETGEVAMLVADLPTLAGPAADVELLPRPDASWWRLSLGRAPTPAERHVLDPPTGPRTAYGLLPGGVVRAAIVGDHLHLSRLHVAPDARGRGAGRALTAAAAGWGLTLGARWAVLQVALTNTEARAFYARLGCVEHHRYRYLVPP